MGQIRSVVGKTRYGFYISKEDHSTDFRANMSIDNKPENPSRPSSPAQPRISDSIRGKFFLNKFFLDIASNYEAPGVLNACVVELHINRFQKSAKLPTSPVRRQRLRLFDIHISSRFHKLAHRQPVNGGAGKRSGKKPFIASKSFSARAVAPQLESGVENPERQGCSGSGQS
jgi:hypothetical protein